MKRMLLALVLLVSCTGKSGTDGTHIKDVPLSDESGQDVQVDQRARLEIGADADIGPELPDHSFVFEELDHPACLPDGPYMVDRVEMVRTTEELADLDGRALLPTGNSLLVGTASGLYRRKEGDGAFSPVTAQLAGETIEAAVEHIHHSPEGGYLVTYAFDDCSSAIVEFSEELAPGVVHKLPACTCRADEFAALTCAGKSYTIVGGDLVGLVGWCPGARAANAMACRQGELWIADDDGIWREDEGQWVKMWPHEGNQKVTVLVDGPGGIWAGSQDHLIRIVGMEDSAQYAAGPGALPLASFRSLAVADDGGKLAIGHDIGVTIMNVADGTVEHFHSQRYLPAEQVNALAWLPDGSLMAATSLGLSRLHKEETTLQAKAERLFEKLDKWFWRMDGFLTAGARFDDPWDDDTSFLWDDDNDGQWTEEGVGAFCYAYAVTGDKKYYEAARKAVTNMVMLVDVPAPDFEAKGLGKGFVTRSLVRDDEGEVFESKADQGNWHLVHHTDGHDYYWKDDTSSDETTGHFFGLPIYYDLCAKDDEERQWVADRITALAGYIVDHGYKLVDLDGEATTHGDWSPERLAIAVDGMEACVADGHELVACIEAWMGAAHLDSIELLGHIIAAWHVSGDPRFLDAYEELIEVHRYDDAAVFHDEIVTWTEKGMANYCDHELADLAWLTLIRYDPDPVRREKWVKSMSDAYKWEAEERNPLKSLALAAALAESPGLEAGVQSLVEYPEDLRLWFFDNSHRLDAEHDIDDRHGDPQFKTVFPYDELPVLRWDHNPYGMTSNGDGRTRMNPAFWLLPYWGLRYYGAICAD